MMAPQRRLRSDAANASTTDREEVLVLRAKVALLEDEVRYLRGELAAVVRSPGAVRPPPRPAKSGDGGERDAIIDALERSRWNKVAAAEYLGVPRRSFYRKLQRFAIK